MSKTKKILLTVLLGILIICNIYFAIIEFWKLICYLEESLLVSVPEWVTRLDFASFIFSIIYRLTMVGLFVFTTIITWIKKEKEKVLA